MNQPSPPAIDMNQTEPVGFLRRMAAILYDSLLLTGLLFLAMFLVVVPLGLMQGLEQMNTAGLRQNPFYLLYLCSVPLLFFVGFWTCGSNQTLGMRAWHIRLVCPDGTPPDLRLALLRWLAAILSWLPLGLGFIWSLIDAEQLTWHDRLSGTRLVLIR